MQHYFHEPCFNQLYQEWLFVLITQIGKEKETLKKKNLLSPSRLGTDNASA